MRGNFRLRRLNLMTNISICQSSSETCMHEKDHLPEIPHIKICTKIIGLLQMENWIDVHI